MAAGDPRARLCGEGTAGALLVLPVYVNGEGILPQQLPAPGQLAGQLSRARRGGGCGGALFDETGRASQLLPLARPGNARLQQGRLAVGPHRLRAR